MKVCFFIIFCTIVFETISSENVHQEVWDKESDFKHYKKEIGHQRYARHIKAVTESVIEHLLKEIKKKYSDSDKRVTKHQLARVAQEITNKMKHLRMKQAKKQKKQKKRISRRAKNKKKSSKKTKLTSKPMPWQLVTKKAGHKFEMLPPY